MTTLSAVVEQLKAERERVHQEVQRIDAALAALASVTTNGTRPHMSAAARRRISIAQKRRWAKRRAPKPKRIVSAAARRKMVAAQRRRRAKVKARDLKETDRMIGDKTPFGLVPIFPQRRRCVVLYAAAGCPATSVKPSIACVNCESTSSAMVMTSGNSKLKSSALRFFCNVPNSVTWSIRESCTSIAEV